ncbi:MAG: hypothetical protein ACO2PM_14730 [Pyrobaculum sp.]|jgi:hypothetical protein
MECCTDAERGGRTHVGEGVAQNRDTDSVAFKALIAAMEGSAKKSLRYSRAVGFLSALEVASLLSVAASLAAFVFTGNVHWLLVAAAFAAAAAASNWLQTRLYGMALRELDRLELLAAVAALATGRSDLALAVLREKAEELKKRRRGGASE